MDQSLGDSGKEHEFCLYLGSGGFLSSHDLVHVSS